MTVELRILLLIGLFAAGFIARRVGWLKPQHAGRMLQLVITAGLPALFLADVSRVPLRADLVALPASAVIIIIACGAASLLAGRLMGLQRTEQGSMTICAMSINNGFLFPVAIARRVLSFPPLWALLAALALNVTGTHLPDLATTVLGTVGRWILMLVIVALGVLFDARLLGDARVLVTLALRILLGLAVGYACVELFGITGLTRSVLLLGAAAPIGFSAVVIANRENLHRELAASAASISVLLALVFVPLALWLLPR